MMYRKSFPGGQNFWQFLHLTNGKQFLEREQSWLQVIHYDRTIAYKTFERGLNLKKILLHCFYKALNHRQQSYVKAVQHLQLANERNWIWNCNVRLVMVLLVVVTTIRKVLTCWSNHLVMMTVNKVELVKFLILLLASLAIKTDRINPVQNFFGDSHEIWSG